MKLTQYQINQLDQSLKNLVHSLAAEYECGVFEILENIHKVCGAGSTNPVTPNDFSGMEKLSIDREEFDAYRHEASGRILTFEYNDMAECGVLTNSYTEEEFKAIATITDVFQEAADEVYLILEGCHITEVGIMTFASDDVVAEDGIAWNNCSSVRDAIEERFNYLNELLGGIDGDEEIEVEEIVDNDEVTRAVVKVAGYTLCHFMFSGPGNDDKESGSYGSGVSAFGLTAATSGSLCAHRGRTCNDDKESDVANQAQEVYASFVNGNFTTAREELADANDIIEEVAEFIVTQKSEFSEEFRDWFMQELASVVKQGHWKVN